MIGNMKAIAMIVAGAVLVALPEPVTTAIGLALISKGIQILKKDAKSELREERKEIEIQEG